MFQKSVTDIFVTLRLAGILLREEMNSKCVGCRNIMLEGVMERISKQCGIYLQC